MARTKVSHRKLPLPPHLAIKGKENRGLQLRHILRDLALKHRTQEPQVFYPIRDLSRHFRVPLSTVARVYDELEAEGILVRGWGFKALLQGTCSGTPLRRL